MPFSAIIVKPGVNTVATPTLNIAGISASNLIRFRDGLPEKMGGWQRFVANAMDSITRDVHAWEDLNDNGWLGVGSLLSLKAISNGVINDITPQFLISDFNANYTTTSGSANIQVVDTNINNLSVYTAVYFNTPITVGGIALSGMYPLNGPGSGTGYNIDAGRPAVTSVPNGGAVPSLATTANSAVITVTFANHGLSDGDSFYFPIATIVGGISITGSYEVSNTATSTFQIAAASNAATSETVSMNGGQAQMLYLIAIGPTADATVGELPTIGEFAIGQASSRTTTITTQTGDPIIATDWTLDNWGEVLLANPKGGAIYYWPPGAGFATAIPIGSGPPQNNGIFVSMPQQILCAYGSAKTLRVGNLDSSIDRLRMRWSTDGDFTNWLVSPLTLAGSFHLGTGSKIVGAIQAANLALVLTDIDAYTMSFVGYPLVFSFNQTATNCGLVGPHAIASMRGIIYWMSDGNFYAATGASGVRSIPCSVWDNVFQDLDSQNAHKACAGANSDFNEIIFFFPSATGGTGENDKYAKLHVNDGTWDYGDLPRSAWTDRTVLGPAIGADPDTTYLQQHEIGYSDDGAVMNSYFETGLFAVGDGENLATVDHFEPDMKWATASSSDSTSVSVTLTALEYPNGESMTETLTMSSTIPYLNPRVRGRLAKWKIETNDANGWWRLGNTRYRYNITGKR